MADERLVEYIKSNLAKGHNLEEIRKFVIQQGGYRDEEINEAILEASGSQKGAGGPEVDITGKKKGGHKKLILALIILIILVLVFLYMATDILSYFKEMFPEIMLPF